MAREADMGSPDRDLKGMGRLLGCASACREISVPSERLRRLTRTSSQGAQRMPSRSAVRRTWPAAVLAVTVLLSGCGAEPTESQGGTTPTEAQAYAEAERQMHVLAARADPALSWERTGQLGYLECGNYGLPALEPLPDDNVREWTWRAVLSGPAQSEQLLSSFASVFEDAGWERQERIPPGAALGAVNRTGDGPDYYWRLETSPGEARLIGRSPCLGPRGDKD